MTAAEKTRLLAERAMGLEVRQRECGNWQAKVYEDETKALYSWVWLGEPRSGFCRNWAPLTNLAHAGEVVEAMAKKGWSARIATNAWAPTQNGCEFFRDYLGIGNDIFSGNYSKYGPDKRVCAVAETIPTAICHAALLAVGVKEEEL